MVKRLALILAVLYWMIPINGHALGLGSIDMRSALNQPLDAKIDLLRVRPGELKDLKVTLASPDAFRRAGIDRPSYLSQLKFNVIDKSGENPYVRISTTQPITEPFLNFLLEVSWANGRLLREFTVLVDPPVLTAQKPAAIKTPEAPAATEKPAMTAKADRVSPQPATSPVSRPTRPAPQTRTKPKTTATLNTSSNGAVKYGPVKRNDTLWEIASEMRTDKSVSVQQIMLTLLESNPEAFYNHNINNLKMGYVLRMENISEATTISKGEASRIVAMQWEQWKQSRGMIAATPSRKSGANRVAQGPDGARVKLVTPKGESSSDSAAPRPVGANGKDVSQLTQELNLAQETLDASRRESKELSDRVTALEEQLSTMQRLIMLKDDQLVALQNQLKKAGEEPQMPAATAEVKQEQNPVTEKVAAAETPAQQPEVAPNPASGDFITSFVADPKVFGPVVAVMLGIMGWLYVRRRKMQQFQESILTGQSSIGESAVEIQPTSEEASFMSDFAVSSMEGIQTEISEVDPISEADVYLAYGRYKQAEDLINQAIQNDPDRLELRLKALEIHYAAKDKEAFELQAEMFRDALGGKHPEMWEKVIQMGHELSPENGMFGSAYTSDNHHAAEEFEFNEQDLPELSLQDQVFSPEESQDHEASDLDFDLSAIESEETDVGTNESVGNTNDNSLDFDLGAFDFKQTKSEEAQVAESDSGLDFDLSALDDLDATKDSSTMKAEDDNRSLDFDISSKAEVEDAQNDQNVVDFDFDTSASAQSSDISDHETSFDTVAERESKDESFDFDLSSFENQPANQEDNVYAMNMGKPSSTELEIKEVEIDSELDDSLFADVDEVGTKLDLARAYIDMGDSEGARSILDEVIEEGNDNQKHEAEGLIRQMG